MKRSLVSTFLGLGLAATSFADFFPYDSLIVTRVNGTSGACSVDLVGFNFGGTTNGQVVDLTSNGGITISATATSEGYTNASNNYLALAGYSSPVGTPFVSTATGPRRVAVFDNSGSGSVSFTTLPSDVYDGRTIRSAHVDTLGTVLTGGEGGWKSTTAGSSSNLGTNTTAYVIKSHEGVLYGSSGGGSNRGVFSLSGSTQTTVIAAGASASTNDFEFYSEGLNNYILVADSRAAASGGGLQVWKNGSLVKTFEMSALRSIAIRNWVDAGVPKTTVFGTSTLNTLSALTFDVGTLESSAASFATIATAAAGTTFRSVVVVPEPASMMAFGVGVAGLIARRRRKTA